MTHDGAHLTQIIKQTSPDGVERAVGVTCLDCDKTWWKDGKVTTP